MYHSGRSCQDSDAKMGKMLNFSLSLEHHYREWLYDLSYEWNLYPSQTGQEDAAMASEVGHRELSLGCK